MRRVLTLCLVACSSPSSPPQQQAALPATAPPLVVSPAASSEPVEFGAPVAAASDGTPVNKLSAPAQLWNARPGVPIAAVFATEDGGAAVSIDESNHARLWPALDGTREPFVLPLGMPAQVAVERDGDGFAIAARDDSFGLELLTVDKAGQLTSHVKLAPEPGFESVVATGTAFVAVRRDQAIDVLDHHGTRTTTLSPAAGEHVMKLLTRKGATLALVRTSEGVRGRWLVVTNGRLGWGDETPKLPIELDRVFLSPDHQRLLTFRRGKGRDAMFDTALVELATGHVKIVSDSERVLALPLGFAGDGRYVLSVNDFELSTFEWWTVKGFQNAIIGGNNYALEFVSVDAPVVTDTNIVTFSGKELAIATPNTAREPSQLRFLGYRSRRVTAVRSTPLGVVASVSGTQSLLDAQVHVTRRLPGEAPIPVAPGLAVVGRVPSQPQAPNAAPIDPDWLEVPVTTKGRVRPHLALYDLEGKRELQQWPMPRSFAFEAATQLLALDRGTKVELAKLDATTRAFGPSHAIAGSLSRVALLDPALADGAIALLVREHAGTIALQTVTELDGAPSPPRSVTGKLEAIDRAGRIYVRVDRDTVVVDHDAHEPVRITGLDGWTIRPSPTGNAIATFARNRLSLLDQNGAPVWSVGFPGITDAVWTADGQLVVVAGDLARVDAASGRVVAAQCGWAFALRSDRPEPEDFPGTTETLCDQ